MKPPNYHIRDLPEPPLPVVSTKATTKLLRKLQKRRGRSLTPTKTLFGGGRGGPPGRRKQVAISASAPKIALCHYCQQPYGAWALDQHEVVCPMRPEVRQLTEE